MTSTLDRLDELRDALKLPATETDFAHWWSLVQLICADVEADAKAPKGQRQRLTALRDGVTFAIGEGRDGSDNGFHRPPLPFNR